MGPVDPGRRVPLLAAPAGGQQKKQDRRNEKIPVNSRHCELLCKRGRRIRAPGEEAGKPNIAGRTEHTYEGDPSQRFSMKTVLLRKAVS
jgi:hypothetical protein